MAAKMEKRFQVFVSSTFEDLKDERLEVVKALLELNCFPSGMEYFPAASEDQWSFIKRLIDESDYYLLVIAGKYGSTDPSGTSYTQKEYEYAVEKNIPVIAFLHARPENIPLGKSETIPERIEKLENFRGMAQTRLCKFWESSAELGRVVSSSLSQLMIRQPRDGWVSFASIKDLLGKEKINSSSFFSENYVNNSEVFQDCFRTAKEIVIAGYAQNRMMVAYSAEIERILKNKGTAKIIVLDPDGQAVELANVRSSNPSEIDESRFQHKAALARLNAIQKRVGTLGDLQIRLIDYLLPYTIYGFDLSNEESATIFVWLTPFQEPSISRPGFILRKQSDARWFTFFQLQFSRLWDWEATREYDSDIRTS
ncbi:MAG TPA: DUF4062 domain-containing protein, partial [Pyrinomonadaceae bacterium]|nr:DUF4062 domain-containing protein [Pyrinomonadaceae bacterium]